MKNYQKTYFDPFSRGDRIPFFMNNTCIITTIGQLNFFRWFISKNVYNYLLDIKTTIYNDMNKKNKLDKIPIIKHSKQQMKIKDTQYYENQKKHIISMNNIIEKDKKIVNITVTFE